MVERKAFLNTEFEEKPWIIHNEENIRNKEIIIGR